MTQTKNITPLTAYQKLLKTGSIQADSAQQSVMEELQALYDSLTADSNEESRSWLPWKKGAHSSKQHTNYYIWGDVGRGKTMLMDLFYDSMPDHIHCDRIHYHAFMADIHERLHDQRQSDPTGNDPLAIVAAKYGSALQLLCIDEFQVHDITDAMILSRLFTILLNMNLTIVTTSNRPPKDLYLDGLQRDSFLPFIDLVYKQFAILELESPNDYRMQKLRGHPCYFTPANNTAEMQEMFDDLATHTARPTILHVKGRDVTIPKTADGIAWCHFDELCRAALGAEDYAALAAEFHTVFLEGIPKLQAEDRNEAKRFTNLIDTLYEHQVSLICSAECPMDDIYAMGDGSFEFQRTLSRLHEMQSQDYLGTSHIA